MEEVATVKPSGNSVA